MNVHHYRCPNCIVEFFSENMLYCPFCSTELQKQGLAEYTARDYILAGWNCTAFRSIKSGCIVRNIAKEVKGEGTQSL